MANRFNTPFPEFRDDSGSPREGARLFFYESGTSTKLDTYSDEALSVANTNPIVLDESGRPEVAIFLKNQDYKVVLAGSVETPGSDDPPTNIIWTADPVRSSDFSSFVLFKTGSGSPSGVESGNAGSAGVLPTMYWDYTNSILYACTTTGTALTATWDALNSSSEGSFFLPAGRLTLTSGTPVLSSDVTAATAIYYTPYTGNAVPIYNGASFIMRTFSELTLALHSSHALSTLYDVFIFDDSGTLTLGTGPAWTTNTAGSCARGTGAGTTELSRVTGLYTNAVSMTARNGTTTYSVGANLGLYLGTFFTDGTAGQTTCHVATGQSRKYGVWNAYNRVPITIRCLDASGGTPGATRRPLNNDATNKITTLCGLSEESIELSYIMQGLVLPVTGAAGGIFIDTGIGENSTTAASGQVGHVGSVTQAANNGHQVEANLVSTLTKVPAIGINNYTALELRSSSGGGGTASLAAGTMIFRANYRA